MTKIKFTIITLFQETLEPYLNASMMWKAKENGIAEFNFVNLRDFGLGPHKKVDDTIYGGDGNDVLNGNNGDDLIYGGEGNDVIEGGAGNDTINGTGWNDISGGEGDDLIYGGNNGGFLSGDEGNDTIYAGSGAESRCARGREPGRHGRCGHCTTVRFR